LNSHGSTGGSANLSNSVFGPVIPPPLDNTALEAHMRRGSAAVMSLGWGFGNGFRAELEGNYRHNSVKEVEFTSFDNAGRRANNEKGDIRTYGLMANGFYEIELGPVRPYLGGGVGYAQNKWHQVGGTNSVFATDQLFISGKESKFAYQGIAGVALPIDAVPGLSLTAEYRYFGTNSGKMTGTYRLSGAKIGDATVKADNDNQSVLIGLRYSFGN
jgi:opacity protein-like surface antigen